MSAQNNLPTPKQANQVAMPNGRAFMPTEQQWQQIKEMGLAAVKSNMIPKAISSPEAAAIIGLKAFELGIPLMEGFAHIHVINGRPTISRELMQTLVTQNIPGAVIDILESTDKIAKVDGRRPGRQPLIWTFTIEDAKNAGLLIKDVWKQYPKAMLLNRAVSALCRAYFPDGLRGCSYTPEEIEPAIETTGKTLPSEPAKKPEVEVVSTVSEPAKEEPPVPPVRPLTTEPANTTPQVFAKEPELSQAQLDRLFAIAGAHGVKNVQLKEAAFTRYGITSSKDLSRKQYEELCQDIEMGMLTQAQQTETEPGWTG